MWSEVLFVKEACVETLILYTPPPTFFLSGVLKKEVGLMNMSEKNTPFRGFHGIIKFSQTLVKEKRLL